MKLTPKIFAAALKMHRERLGMTLPQMAELLAISPRAMWQWENAEVSPLAVAMEGALERAKKAKPLARKVKSEGVPTGR